MRRIFFALWPQKVVRADWVAATATLVGSVDGRAIPPANLHVTLLFIGAVEESQLPALHAIGAAVASAAPVSGHHPDNAAGSASLRFTQLEYWRKPRVLVATEPDSPISAGRELAQALADRLRAETVRSGFTPDLKPFRPHITLVRKVRHPQGRQLLPALSCPVDSVALVDSRTEAEGSVYTVLQSFPVAIDGSA